MADATVTGTSIEVRRTYRAPRELVFTAWTDPEALRRWYAPVEGWVVSHAEVDAREGGGYHLEFGPPGGEPVVEHATYRVFEPPARLVIEVRLDGAVSGEATIATIEFIEIGGETEVVVSEGPYSSEEVATRHAGGWTTVLDNLDAVVG